MNRGHYFCFVLFFFANIVVYSQNNYYEYFTDKTLRIDYLRTGNILDDSISVQSMFVEDFWSGCRSRTIEPYDYGDYKIEIYSVTNKKRIFTYSYSSLFAEYIYTSEGRNETKTFQETVRFPFPKTPIEVVFYKRFFENNSWKKQFEIILDPEKIEISNHSKQQQPIVQKIYQSGAPEKKADIAIVAEGYAAGQSEKFFDDASRIAGYILNCEPFSLHQTKFNIWAVFAASEQEGITDPSESITKTTLLGSNFSTFGSERYLMTENHFILRDIVSTVPYDHLVVLVNVNKYGGGGIYNFYATCPADDPNSDFLTVHEFGHSFAGLADEYWTSDVSVIDYYSSDIEPVEPNITTLVSFESKWKEMIDDETPVPTPDQKAYRGKVGVFEGGGYREKGIYRPFFDCTMKSLNYDAFCPVCKSAIEKTIIHFSE